MNTIFQILLVAHVLGGLLGIIFFLCALLCLARPHGERWRAVTALLGTVSFWLAWFLGGAYYTQYYGKNVKPVILSGATPWVHAVLMEAKEHVFLFLPFLGVTAFLALWLAKKEIGVNPSLRASVAALLGLIIVLGFAMTASGILISAAGGR